MTAHWCLLLLLAADAPRTVYRIETVAGSSRIGDGGPAAAAQFGAIQGVAVDRWGNAYLSDTDNHRVRKVDAQGTVTTIAGTGAPGFSGDGGPAVAARLNLPYGVAVDQAGSVYIADLGNNRVRRVSPDGVISTVAGSGEKGSSGDGVAAKDAALMAPRNVALDGAGNLYISEFEGHRVRRVTPGGWVRAIAGTGIRGSSHCEGDRDHPPQLSSPAGLAVDSAGSVYIADSGNGRICKVEADGSTSTYLGPDAAAANPYYGRPTGLALDSAGTLYVADGEGGVHLYNPARSWWLTVAGSGAARLSAARDVASDGQNVYIADGNRVRKMDQRQAISVLAGDGYIRAIGDGGEATEAVLAGPSAVVLDSAGRLFIADTFTHRVRAVDGAGTVTTLAGTGRADLGPDSGPAGTSPLDSPAGVAVDPWGVLVADSGNRLVRRVSPDGRMRTVAGSRADGPGVEGSKPLETPFSRPAGLCVDEAGRYALPGVASPLAPGAIFVVDAGNHRVLRASGEEVVTAAGNGTPGYAGDGGPARLAELHDPTACAFDGAGNLFIADTGNHRIRKAGAGGIVTVAGTGEEGFAGDEGPAAAAQLSAPRGVAADSDGNIFIADTGNHRIRQITPDGVIHTIAGRDGPGFAGDGGPAPAAQVNAPAGLILDGSGDLYVADSGNNRVRRLVPGFVVTPEPVERPPSISVVNAASLRPGPVAPGEIVTIFGTAIGPEAGAVGLYDSAGLLVTQLAGAEARFNGVAAPLLYAGGGQVNAQVPYSIAAGAAARVEVFFQARAAGSTEVEVAAAAPAIFSNVVNQDGAPNAETTPASRGDVIVLYATGEGLTDGPNTPGRRAEAPYPHPELPVTLTIAGIEAQILYAGSAPGLIGLMQVNARVPGGFVPPGRAAAQLKVGEAASPEITVWLK